MNQNLRLFIDLSKTKPDVFKDLYGKFHNADMLKVYYLNEETRPLQLLRKAIPLNWMIFALWMKISKTYLSNHAGCLQDQPIISDNQTFFNQSPQNKDFSWSFLQKLLKTKYFSST